jgi:hypothetical protein
VRLAKTWKSTVSTCQSSKSLLQKMDDFLWSCALQDSPNDRLDIIPDFEEDFSHFGIDDKSGVGGTSAYLLQQFHGVDQAGLVVQINESRSNGVLDIIGGELWEGSLLLCAYIIRHQEKFLECSVLELGSGVSLPGLLLAALKCRHPLLKSTSLTLSDNDPRVVENLSYSVLQQFTVQQVNEDNDVNESSFLCPLILSTQILDWSKYMQYIDGKGNGLSESTENQLPVVLTLQVPEPVQCELIMGCELCYAPYHARCLAGLFRYDYR